MFGTPMDSEITGFEFHIRDFETCRDKKTVKVDYLNNGKELYTETLRDITDEEIANLQEQLLDLVIVNLTIKDDWTNAKETSKRNKVLGVFNMFRIEKKKKNEDQTMDVKIVFIRSGYRLAGHVINRVSEERLKKITEIIADNVSYNLTCCNQCNATTYLDLLAVLENSK